jgi:hypothetical protein
MLSQRRHRHRFSVRYLQPHRLVDYLFEWLEVSGGGPHLQFGVAAAVQLDDDVFATVVNFET